MSGEVTYGAIRVRCHRATMDVIYGKSVIYGCG
jgi:hypothetical protein